MIEYEAHIGRQTYVPDGSQVNAEVLNPVEDIPTGPVSDHEGVHSFLLIKRGIGVRRASRIPGPGFLGITEPFGFDGPATVGPAALDMGGVGHDLGLEEYYGGNVEADKAVARQLINEDPRGLKKIAVLIEQRGTVSGAEMERELEKGEDVLVTIKRPDGTVEKRVEEDVKGEVIMFPGREVDLAKAA